MASLVWRVENFVVEHREVKSESKTDGVGWGKLGLGHLDGVLVSSQGVVGGALALISQGKFGKITVIISLPVTRKVLRQTNALISFTL